MLHVKLMGMKQSTQCKQIVYPFIHPHIFVKKAVLQIKGEKCRKIGKFDVMHTLNFGGLGKKVIVQISILNLVNRYPLDMN